MESSTHREIRGVWYALQPFEINCSGRSVLVQVDNQNVSRIFVHGSSKEVLAELAKRMHIWCASRRISVSIRWVPREFNTHADALSKVPDRDDWRLHPRFFRTLDAHWGPHTVDAFANDRNSHCVRFYSKYHCPGSAGVDAFLQPWYRDRIWANPPFGAIGKILSKIQSEGAAGTLIVPVWPARP